MKKILKNRKASIGTIWAETDENFISIINAMVKLANPDLTIKGYSTPSTTQPTTPALNDAYLIIETGTIWGISSQTNDIISYNGETWVKEGFSLNELNSTFQALFFDAENIALMPPAGMQATNLQSAIEELAAKIFTSTPLGSGSGNEPGSGSN